MKMKRLTAISLGCAFFSVGLMLFTEKANAGAAVSRTATFSATVAPSCTVFKEFNTTSGNYTPTGVGAAGGVTQLRRVKQAAFDCNSDTVTVSAVVTLTQPIPNNATAIVGIHTTDLTDGTNGDLSIHQTGGGTLGPATATTDQNGDIIVFAASQWNSQGEDLLSGSYAATIAVSVTAN